MYYLDKSILTKGFYVFAIIAIYFIFLRQRTNKLKSLFSILFFTVSYLYLEERLLPFPLLLKMPYSDSNWTDQFFINLDWLLYGSIFLYGVVFMFLGQVLFKNSRKILACLKLSLSVTVLMISFVFFINLLCGGTYQVIDPIEDICFIAGSGIGYLSHKQYFINKSLQQVIDNSKKKIKFYYDF
jgi:hypothetical protein